MCQKLKRNIYSGKGIFYSITAQRLKIPVRFHPEDFPSVLRQ